MNFPKFLRTVFLTEHLWWLLLIVSRPQMRIRKTDQLGQFRWTFSKIISIHQLYNSRILTMSHSIKKSSGCWSRNSLHLCLQVIWNTKIVFRVTSHEVTTVFHAKLDVEFTKTIERQFSWMLHWKTLGTNQSPIFFRGSFSNKDNVKTPVQFR